MSIAVADSSSKRVAERKSHPLLVEVLIRLIKEKPLGTVGGIVTLLLLLTGIFAHLLAPYGMNDTNMEVMLSPSSAKYLLGTDELGGDSP